MQAEISNDEIDRHNTFLFYAEFNRRKSESGPKNEAASG